MEESLEASIGLLVMEYVDIHRDADNGVHVPLGRMARMERKGGVLARRMGYPDGFHIAATEDPDHGVQVVLKMGRFYLPDYTWILALPLEDDCEDPVERLMWSDQFLILVAKRGFVDRVILEMSLGSLTEGEVDLEDGNLSCVVPRQSLAHALDIVKGLVGIKA